MSNEERIAIVGIGLRYPDASTPEELWENVLSGRRAFRRLPDERMNHADYYSPDPHAPDRFYAAKAAVLRNFEFPRMEYKVAGSTYRSTDLTHWLALDVAAHALADAGFPNGDGLPRQSTGVVLGNSLTGEFSRANMMRLRWPYVRRTLAAALAAKGWPEDEAAPFIRDMEIRYKAPFPHIDEDTLAGGLANTIAGRICNYFDLAGGGYTVDGACSSSLLAIVTAAKALTDHDSDVVLAGGVDLSIDPFELIGFAKTGALATSTMKIYDKDSNGFWPGEGSGVVVLMREADARKLGKRIYATITGWGVSSDGKGGITRPEAAGHRLALTRAYQRAGYGVETVSYFEGHGTGTALGDATEIEALGSARLLADPSAPPAALSSLKGNIGHTKAAAGIAGLIKATLAVHNQVIPPATGHDNPHPKLLGESPALYVPREAEQWPADRPIRAGVSAMGFGGINTHIAIEQAPGTERQDRLGRDTVSLVTGRQDVELLLLDAASVADLRALLTRLQDLVAKLSFAELTDLAGSLAKSVSGQPVRAAVVAANPDDALDKLTRLRAELDAGSERVFAPAEGIFLATGSTPPKIAYLFPGQGSGRGAVGAIRRRFPVAEWVYRVARLPSGGDQVATEVAQPRIVAGSLAGVRVLGTLGIEADVAVGHSLGELSALAWGGAMGGKQLLRLAAARGQIMARASQGGGTMAGLAAGPDVVQRLIEGAGVVIAGYNSPQQTVISGPAKDVDRVCELATAEGIGATRINVSHAFHSPLVRPAAEGMGERLADEPFNPLARRVVSTVTGEVLDPDTDLADLLRDQVLFPVRFTEAAGRAVADVDLAVEVGPGRVLAGLVKQIAPDKPVLSVDTDSQSLAPLLAVAGAAHALGAHLDTEALFEGRLVRPLPADDEFTFLTSPCETAPDIDVGLTSGAEPAEQAADAPATNEDAGETATLDLVRKLVAERVELPVDMVHPDTLPLDDLHLSSITVGQIVNEVTRQQNRPALSATANFATVSIGELAALIDQMAETSQQADTEADGVVTGVAPWVAPFSVDYVVSPHAVVAPAGGPSGQWTLFAPPDHPLAEPLRTALGSAGVGNGVLLCLPDDGEDHVNLFLKAGQAAAAAPTGSRFVVVQHRLGAAGLARTLHLEAPSIRTTVIGLPVPLPSDVDELVRRVIADVAATARFTEVRYDPDGTRRLPVLRAVPKPVGTEQVSPLDADDVLLVTGGGKGITAECALAIATDSSAALALIGRADPHEDTELAGNLARMAAAGVRYHYERADVTDAEQVGAAVSRLQAELGPVTAVLHGAGRNEPCALANLGEEQFRQTLAPKITGLRAVLGAVDADRIKLLITFGSIIGRAGLRGEAHYSTANDWMSELTVRFGAEHPRARVLALEWSVWSGAGMGERLGVVEALMREGITPISTDHGIAVLRQVLADPQAGPVLVVTGRAEGLPTLTLQRQELPLTRFVDNVLVHYPNVELVTEADLSSDNDPYLDDHLVDGDLLFPAVLGMEAMTQVVSAMTGKQGPPLLEDVQFLRPIVVRPNVTTTIRVAALVRDADTADVAIRSAETGFSADHFRARLRMPRPDVPGEPGPGAAELPAVPVDPVTELYGDVLFQGKRFQRLLAYRHAGARRAVAELSTESPSMWFAAFLSQELLLADPGTRDAVMHSIQCCVPDATLLPQGIERLYLADPADQESSYLVMDARERYQHGDTYCYDVTVYDPSGRVVERWDGLTLRAVRKTDGSGPWVPSLLGPHVERALENILGGSRTVVVEPDPITGEDGAGADRRSQTELAVSRALDRPVRVRHRPDGKPEVDGAAMSASHTAGLTMVVVGSGRLGCDIETVVERSAEDWAGLLGKAQLGVRDLLMTESGDSAAVAGTRVWSALECLRKTGATTQALTVDRVDHGGWVVLSAGDATIATWVTTVHDRPDPVVIAVLSGEEF